MPVTSAIRRTTCGNAAEQRIPGYNAHMDLEGLAAAVNSETALVSLLYANNETGVLFPVTQIAQICHAHKVPFHCDATQAVGKVPLTVQAIGADAMSFAAHKFHGPKGV